MSAAEAAAREHVAFMLLTPPEVPTFEALMDWGHRLRAGMKAGIVTHRQANEVWRRAVASTPTGDRA